MSRSDEREDGASDRVRARAHRGSAGVVDGGDGAGAGSGADVSTPGGPTFGAGGIERVLGMSGVSVRLDEPCVTPALGPGDDDPRSPARRGYETGRAALLPGDDDPRSPAKGEPEVTRGPLAPGESNGTNDDDAFHFLTPAPDGPGGIAIGPRQLVRIPKRG